MTRKPVPRVSAHLEGWDAITAFVLAIYEAEVAKKVTQARVERLHAEVAREAEDREQPVRVAS